VGTSAHGFSTFEYFDDTGTGIVVTPQPSNFPGSLQITIDPTRLKDAEGNAGQGVPQTAQYMDVSQIGTDGPVVNYEQGLPLRSEPEGLFDVSVTFR